MKYYTMSIYISWYSGTPWSKKTIVHHSGEPIDLSGRSPQLSVFTCEVLWGCYQSPKCHDTQPSEICIYTELEFFQVSLNDFLTLKFDQLRVRWGCYNLYLYTSPWNQIFQNTAKHLEVLKLFCQSSGDMMASPPSTTAWYPSMTLSSEVCPVFVQSVVSSPNVLDRTITCSNLKLSLLCFVVGMCCIMNPCWNK